MANSISGPDGRGGFRAVAVQGQQVWVGPVHVGVMSAREGDLPDGSTGLRAKLQLAGPDGVEIRVVVPGDEVHYPGHGVLRVVGIKPPPLLWRTDSAPDRGIVGLEFHPDEADA